MAKDNSGRIVCPKTREVYHFSDAERIYVM